MGDGVLCAVDRDRDGYTEVDLSALRYCQSNSDNQLCQQVRDSDVNHTCTQTHSQYRTSAQICITPCNYQTNWMESIPMEVYYVHD